jgi:hypothetical protein
MTNASTNSREEKRKAREERKALVNKTYEFAEPLVKENLLYCASFARAIGRCIKNNNYQWQGNVEKMLSFADAVEQKYGKIQVADIELTEEMIRMQIARIWRFNRFYIKVEENIAKSGVSMETFCGMDGELRLKFKEEIDLYSQFRESLRGI